MVCITHTYSRKEGNNMPKKAAQPTSLFNREPKKIPLSKGIRVVIVPKGMRIPRARTRLGSLKVTKVG